MHLHPEATRHLIDHNEEHVKSSEFIKDIVIGMSDGLTVPFALAAGLSGAVDSTALVITAGIAEIAAGSIAMGLGGYLAGRAEIDHYDSEQKREFYEVENGYNFHHLNVKGAELYSKAFGEKLVELEKARK